MFCGCPVDFSSEPNTNICPVCLGLPGALPVPNERAIEMTVQVGIALGCRIAHRQRVQPQELLLRRPARRTTRSPSSTSRSASAGSLDVEVGERDCAVGITRVHLEEDTGKSTHLGGTGRSTPPRRRCIDFNRSGVPLMEVVSEPDMRTPEQARAYAHGTAGHRPGARRLRCQVGGGQPPLRRQRLDRGRRATTELGVKVEVKNMNSLRSLQRALAFEIERQMARADAGEPIAQETRHWDEAAGVTKPGRSKEQSRTTATSRNPIWCRLQSTTCTASGWRHPCPNSPASSGPATAIWVSIPRPPVSWRRERASTPSSRMRSRPGADARRCGQLAHR